MKKILRRLSLFMLVGTLFLATVIAGVIQNDSHWDGETTNLPATYQE